MEHKAVIAVCAWRQVEVATALCLHQADEAGYDVHYHWNDALISRARSTVATTFLQEWLQYDLLVFIDTDITFTLDTLKKVCDLALEHQAVAVSPYAIRRGKHPWLAFRQLDGGEPVRVGRGTQPIPIKYGATGFMAIPRSVLERMAETLTYCPDMCGQGAQYPFFMPFVQQQPQGYPEPLSEDWAFCQRVQDLGMEVWLQSDTSVGHLGVYEFSLSDVLKDSSFQTEKGLAIEDLAEYWSMQGKTLEKVDGGAAQIELAEAWRTANPQTPEDVDRFYQEQDAYITDLVSFNSQNEYWREMGTLLMVTGEVADFGGGIGSLCIALANRGCRVHYIDLPSPQRSFAEWRFVKHRLPIHVCSALNGLAGLDAIVTADTIEHLHPETLPEFARQFYEALKPGGQVRSITRFGKSDLWPMHYDTGKEFTEAMHGVGFVGGPHIWVKKP